MKQKWYVYFITVNNKAMEATAPILCHLIHTESSINKTLSLTYDFDTNLNSIQLTVYT